MISFLPTKLYNAFKNCNTDKLFEIRLRVNYPVIVNYNEKKLYLAKNGLTLLKNDSLICSEEDINLIINNITEHSIYAYNNKLKQGFITTNDGVRIGLAGECVFNNTIVTIKNITSLNIRIPHEIVGCSNEIINKIKVDKLFNTLIIAPPAFGKTTMLKDIARNLNNINIGNILIIDERGEFSNIDGENIDKIKYSDKLYAFNYSLRSMTPSVVITDELCTKDDWLCVKNASDSGVNIIASCHGKSIDDIKIKEYYIENVFDRFIVLSDKQLGVINGIYDKNYQLI